MGYSIFNQTMVDLTWPEIEEAIRNKAIVLLPVGVIEEHGPHLGLAVDIYVSYLLARKTKKQLEKDGQPTLIAPPYYWGINVLTGTFPGSFSVRPETMQAVLFDTMACLKNWGIDYVFTFNWHAEFKHNQALLEAIKEARQKIGLKAFAVLDESEAKHLKLSGTEDYLSIRRPVPTAATGSSKYLDLHAGSQETAIMLAYFSTQVKSSMLTSLMPSNTTMEDIIAMRHDPKEVRKRIPQGYFGNPAGCNLDEAFKEMESLTQAYAEAIENTIKKT